MEKLTTITSDNELDHDDEKYRSVKPTKRIVSPHPVTTNRIINDNDHTSRRSISGSRSKLNNNDEEDESDDYRKKKNSREQDRSSKKRYDRNDDDDDEFNNVSNRQVQSLTCKSTNGDSSHRSHSKTNGHIDADDDDLR